MCCTRTAALKPKETLKPAEIERQLSGDEAPSSPMLAALTPCPLADGTALFILQGGSAEQLRAARKLWGLRSGNNGPFEPSEVESIPEVHRFELVLDDDAGEAQTRTSKRCKRAPAGTKNKDVLLGVDQAGLEFLALGAPGVLGADKLKHEGAAQFVDKCLSPEGASTIETLIRTYCADGATLDRECVTSVKRAVRAGYGNVPDVAARTDATPAETQQCSLDCSDLPGFITSQAQEKVDVMLKALRERRFELYTTEALRTITEHQFDKFLSSVLEAAAWRSRSWGGGEKPFKPQCAPEDEDDPLIMDNDIDTTVVPEVTVPPYYNTWPVKIMEKAFIKAFPSGDNVKDKQLRRDMRRLTHWLLQMPATTLCAPTSPAALCALAGAHAGRVWRR